MKIVLIGYMGSGKSTIGKLLAEKLDYTFIDLDDYIEDRLQTPILEIFKTKGDIYFRKQEHLLLKEVLQSEGPFVLATGGGAPCYSGNMDLILELGTQAVYLKVSIPTLVDRLYKEKDQRPLISHLDEKDLPEFIGKHLFERSPIYEKATDVILCDTKDPEEISEEIANRN
ncbi:MAG: shikimate kinase [Flavobacteriaceae bacterium]